MAIEYFKILNKQGPSYLQNFIQIKEMPHSFKYTNTAVLPKVRSTTYGLKSLDLNLQKSGILCQSHLETSPLFKSNQT